MNSIKPLFDLSFSRFITTRVAKVLYGLALVLASIGAIVSYFTIVVMAEGFFGTVGAMIFGLPLVALVFLVSVAFVRIGFELTIVLFRIAENVQGIAQAESKRDRVESTTF